MRRRKGRARGAFLLVLDEFLVQARFSAGGRAGARFILTSWWWASQPNDSTCKGRGCDAFHRPACIGRVADVHVLLQDNGVGDQRGRQHDGLRENALGAKLINRQMPTEHLQEHARWSWREHPQIRLKHLAGHDAHPHQLLRRLGAVRALDVCLRAVPGTKDPEHFKHVLQRVVRDWNAHGHRFKGVAAVPAARRGRLWPLDELVKVRREQLVRRVLGCIAHVAAR